MPAPEGPPPQTTQVAWVLKGTSAIPSAKAKANRGFFIHFSPGCFRIKIGTIIDVLVVFSTKYDVNHIPQRPGVFPANLVFSSGVGFRFQTSSGTMSAL